MVEGIDLCEGVLTFKSDEGTLEWIDRNELSNIKQFDMNQKFQEYLWESGIFEERFLLNSDDTVKEYMIRKI